MKKVVINLQSDFGEQLVTACDQFQRDGLFVDVKINKHPNIWEFVFNDPDEKFMFNLGNKYGQLLIKNNLI